MDDRHLLLNEFLKRFPKEKLSEMTLEEYTDLNRDNSFCYWVESKLERLGSIWGSSAYKFGIYRYSKKPGDNAKYRYDDSYSWLANYATDTSDEAFRVVKSAIVNIADCAEKGEFEKIEEEKRLGGLFKWKVAFLYSHESLIPIYSKDLLIGICKMLGFENASKANVYNMQLFLIKDKGDKQVYDYYDSIMAKYRDIEGQQERKVWTYSPGEQAKKWRYCVDNGLMCLGWDELGDFTQYGSKDEIEKAMNATYKKSTGRFTNNSLAVWSFVHGINVGDTIIAKTSYKKIIGRGIVESDYYYDNTTDEYHNLRKVRWENVGEWDTPIRLAKKALTDITNFPEDIKMLKKLFGLEKTSKDESSKYWWLLANPKIFKLSEMAIGDEVMWTLFNENGRKRGGFQHFVEAKEHDIVIGYESTPTLQIVALMEVAEASDGEKITFKKTESLLNPIDLSEVKNTPELQQMEFIRNHMGTFFKLENDEYDVLIEMIRSANPIRDKAELSSYGKEEFLREVFMTDEDYDNLTSLLNIKQNIILQGAPGVGKTFIAKRLAYSIMGNVDEERVEMVQFHQNYSYEDFVMGYKPTENGGFTLKKGAFYNFCKKAVVDRENKYFFIIDEINRGNMSKIFGELLLLIERGYRGKGISLAYNGELFSVPENVYIIGMMNTADRSLAMIDYALRRRFSFFDVKPGFDTEGFKLMQESIDNKKFNNVIVGIKRLNEVITSDESLGDGFCIGHSYFCVESEASVDDKWISNVVEYDIKPMLREYWFDKTNKYKEEVAKLKDLLK